MRHALVGTVLAVIAVSAVTVFGQAAHIALRQAQPQTVASDPQLHRRSAA
jgi:hypothetical protein